MFTGIVKAVSFIAALEKREALLRYAVDFSPELLYGLENGYSISVDGVCQTVVAIEDSRVWFEAIEETLSRTTLHSLKIGSKVNLERAAKMGDEMGGHLLSGHIYGTSRIATIQNTSYTFECHSGWMKYLFSKGFIAVDGISLTLGAVDKEASNFTVHLIPETLKRTTLGHKTVGDRVNLEFDALTQAAVETIENFLSQQSRAC